MGSSEDRNEQALELIGRITRRLLSQKTKAGKDELINELELLSKSTADRRVQECSIRAIQMLSHRIH
ncbi:MULTISPECIES: hypothetical protein [Pantoea]|uniref:hypothetical protein n=1 Tax=Pantoea TaxID=53335 RepID=UPI000D7520AF|nr:hypothetical protein [Pantoea sp. JKS000250]PXW21649.1 hypothetical protein BY447_3369 [Pantoea sp. JKS000250]